MKKYNVTVNGITYEVEVEEVALDATATPVAQPVKNEVKPAPAAKPQSAPAGATLVKAPMPGNIIKVNVKVGDRVNKGDVLCVLEAMKMENEICAPSNGVVASLNISQGATVGADDVLVSLS